MEELLGHLMELVVVRVLKYNETFYRYIIRIIFCWSNVKRMILEGKLVTLPQSNALYWSSWHLLKWMHHINTRSKTNFLYQTSLVLHTLGPRRISLHQASLVSPHKRSNTYFPTPGFPNITHNTRSKANFPATGFPSMTHTLDQTKTDFSTPGFPSTTHARARSKTNFPHQASLAPHAH